MMKSEIEITRHNVTPAAFLSYISRQLKKKGLDMVFEAPNLDYLAAGNDLNFDTTHDGIHEISISKPYEMQTYVRWDNGTVFNIICEFTFWDDKTGTGYFYGLDKEEPEKEPAETVEPDVEPAAAPVYLKKEPCPGVHEIENLQPAAALELLDIIDAYRRYLETNNEPATADGVCRWIAAAVARGAGYIARAEWTDQLLSDPTTYYSQYYEIDSINTRCGFSGYDFQVAYDAGGYRERDILTRCTGFRDLDPATEAGRPGIREFSAPDTTEPGRVLTAQYDYQNHKWTN